MTRAPDTKTKISLVNLEDLFNTMHSHSKHSQDNFALVCRVLNIILNSGNDTLVMSPRKDYLTNASNVKELKALMENNQ